MCKVVETLNKGKNSQSNEGYRDWYVPAAGQLYEIYTNRANINTALTNIGGTTLYTSGLYWSSSEKDADLGWRLDFSNGSVNGSSKVHNLYVRFVRDIN